MTRTPEEYWELVLDRLDATPEGRQRRAKVTTFDRQLGLDWIIAAPTEALREARASRVAESLRWRTSPLSYEIAFYTLMELHALYGAPRLLQQLTPPEQALALQERRVLGASHTRYHDGSDVYISLLTPESRLNDELIWVYPRPCVLADETLGRLSFNGWETTSEIRRLFDPPSPPSAAPPAAPLRLEPRPVYPPGVRHARDAWALAAHWEWSRVVSASADGTLLVWNPATGAALHQLNGHTAPVWAVAITPDGQRAVSASWDTTLRVWDLATGETLRVLAGHQDEIYAVAVTPDGRRAVSGSRDETLRVWDLDTGQQLQVHNHSLEIWDVAVTPDGTRAVSASGDKTLRIWDLADGQPAGVLRGHSHTVEHVLITANGTRAVSGSLDSTLRVWNLTTGEALHVLAGHVAGVLAVAPPPDERQVVSASIDGTVRVWDLETGQVRHVLAGHAAPVWGLALTGDGRRIVSAGRDGQVRVWDRATGRELAALATPAEFTRCCVSPEGTMIVAGDRAGQVHFIRILGA
jgi:WD40 repeat protein